MASFITMQTDDGESFLVEVDALPPKKTGSEQQISLTSTARAATTAAQTTFNSALSTVRANATAFINTVKAIPDVPDEVQVTFGLIVTGEGNMAIAKASGAAGYAVTLIWRRDNSNPAQATATNLLQVPGTGI